MIALPRLRDTEHISTAPRQPAPALPVPEGGAFPEALVRTPHWVGYTWGIRNGKRTKIPKNPHTGKNASSTDPATWADFAAARAFARREGYGLGFMLAPPFVGVDLDGCLDPATGELSTLGASVLGELDTYAEVSISGTGVKAIAYGEKPGDRCRRNGLELEIYSGKRLFALTGERLDGAPLAINDCQDAINHLYVTAFGQPAPAPHTPAPAAPTTDDDRVVLDWLATYRPKFAPLWTGDTGAYNGDESAADQALCNMLAFRTGDENRVDALFRQSGLYRPKWERGDYRERTIGKAMQQRRFFTPAGPTPSSVDTPPRDLPPDTTAGDCPARLTLLQRENDRLRAELAAEREHRAATHALLTNGDMTPVERVAAYGLMIEGVAAAKRGETSDTDPEARPVNCTAIGKNVGLSRQTVSATITRFAERGQLRKATSTKLARSGTPYTEIAVCLPGETLTENLRAAATWQRPAGAKHVGGAGERCPQCSSTKTKKTEETAKVRTTTLACADCGHVHRKQARVIGPTETFVRFGDTSTDIPTMVNAAVLRRARGVSTLDTPPQPEATPASDLSMRGGDIPPSPSDNTPSVERPRVSSRHPQPDIPRPAGVPIPPVAVAPPAEDHHDEVVEGPAAPAPGLLAVEPVDLAVSENRSSDSLEASPSPPIGLTARRPPLCMHCRERMPAADTRPYCPRCEAKGYVNPRLPVAATGRAGPPGGEALGAGD